MAVRNARLHAGFAARRGLEVLDVTPFGRARTVGGLADAALRPRLPIPPTLATPAPPPYSRRRRRRGGAPRLLARALLRPSVRRCHRRTLARTRREPHSEWLCDLRGALRARLRGLAGLQFLRRPLRHRRRILPSVHVGRDARRRRARHPDP